MQTPALTLPASLVLFASLASAPALAAPAKPAKLGLCSACHGVDGTSRTPGTPHLGGQDRIYLERAVGSSRVDLQACKLEYSIVSPK